MARRVFNQDLNCMHLVRDLQLLTNNTIEAGKTLLFFDERQVCPRALLSLCYFFKQLPTFHVIAAGSSLEFALEKYMAIGGMPEVVATWYDKLPY